MDIDKIIRGQAVKLRIDHLTGNLSEMECKTFIEKLLEAINFTRCSTELRRESKSFLNLKTIADIKRLYPNEASYGVSVNSRVMKFYVNNKVIHTKALIT